MSNTYIMNNKDLNRLQFLEQKDKNKEPMSEAELTELNNLFKTRVNEFIQDFRTR